MRSGVPTHLATGPRLTHVKHAQSCLQGSASPGWEGLTLGLGLVRRTQSQLSRVGRTGNLLGCLISLGSAIYSQAFFSRQTLLCNHSASKPTLYSSDYLCDPAIPPPAASAAWGENGRGGPRELHTSSADTSFLQNLTWSKEGSGRAALERGLCLPPSPINISGQGSLSQGLTPPQVKLQSKSRPSSPLDSHSVKVPCWMTTPASHFPFLSPYAPVSAELKSGGDESHKIMLPQRSQTQKSVIPLM